MTIDLEGGGGGAIVCDESIGVFSRVATYYLRKGKWLFQLSKFFFYVIDSWWSYIITVFLCYIGYIGYIGYIYWLQYFSLHVVPLLCVNHLIAFEMNRTVSRNHSWFDFLCGLSLQTSRFTCLIIHFSVYTFDLLPRTIHSSLRSSIRYILRFLQEKVGEGIRTLNPWRSMNLLLTNKPTRPLCPTNCRIDIYHLSLINTLVCSLIW